MSTYRLKRKTFSDDKKSGMGLGTKLALGTAAVGGTLLGAKHGMFGTGIQSSMGKGMMKMGMTKSGAKTMASAKYTENLNHMRGQLKYNNPNMTQGKIDDFIKNKDTFINNTSTRFENVANRAKNNTPKT